MDEEQKAVLAAVARLEENPSGPIDEYTVARAAGILDSDLDGQAYVQSAERGRIRQLFDELDEQGLLRLERGGYWRPRTSLAGRRALQAPVARAGATLTPTRVAAFPAGGGAVPDPRLRAREDDEDERAVAPAGRAWPAWWPAALRFGDPSSTPLLLGIGAIAAFLLVALLAVTALGSGGGDPTPTTSLSAASATAPAAGAASGPPSTAPAATPPPGGATSGASPTPRRGPTSTFTPAPFAPSLIIVNTNGQGVRVFKTPAGERSFAIPEGEEVEVIGPDTQDAQGNIWKHVRYGDGEGWILEQYAKPAE